MSKGKSTSKSANKNTSSSSSSKKKKSNKKAINGDTAPHSNGKTYELGVADHYISLHKKLSKNKKEVYVSPQLYEASSKQSVSGEVTPVNASQVRYMSGIIAKYNKNQFKRSSEPKTVRTDDGIGPEADWDFSDLERKLKYIRAQIPSAKQKQRFDAFIANPENFAANAFYNTIGYPVALYQNARSKRELSKNPNTSKQVVYLMVGIKQNQGGQVALAAELYSRGKIPIHLRPNHGMALENRVDDMVQQIDKIHRKTGLKNASGRYDAAVGHSSGGRNVTMLSRDPRARTYGLNAGVVAVASTHYGMKVDRAGQKLIGMVHDITEDNIADKKTRKYVTEFAQKGAVIPVYQVAGLSDGLVPAKFMADDKAHAHIVIGGKHTTHFGTSGIRSDVNTSIADIVGYQHRNSMRTFYKEAA